MTENRDWKGIADRSKRNRIRFKGFICVYDLLLYVLIIWGVQKGAVWAPMMGEMFASQLPQIAFGCFWEPRGGDRHKPGNRWHDHLRRIFSPKTQSWAFLADWPGLMPMLAVASLAFPHMPGNTLFNGSLWLLWAGVCLVVGIVSAWLFRKGEEDVLDILRWNSFTKLLHNGVAFTILAASIVYTAVPMIVSGAWTGSHHYPFWYFGCLLIWLAAAMADGVRGKLTKDSRWYWLALKAENLHPQADERGQAIFPEIEGVSFANEDRGRAVILADLLHTRKLIPLVQRWLVSLGWLRKRAAVPAEPESEEAERRDRLLSDQEWYKRGPPDPD